MSGAFVTQVGYDQHFNSISGGLGLVVMNDQAGQNTLTTTRITGMYSYQQAITQAFASHGIGSKLFPESSGLEQPDIWRHDRSTSWIHL